jgi:hypothetical protein
MAPLPGPIEPRDERLTIIGLVVKAMRGWIIAAEEAEETDSEAPSAGGAYSVFYVDAERPNEIQMRGASADRCELWIEPSEVRSGPGGTELLVDVRIAHPRDGAPAITKFQVVFDAEMTPLVH